MMHDIDICLCHECIARREARRRHEQNTHSIIFETWIGDEQARVEVPCNESVNHSAEYRKDLEAVAIEAFVNLDSRFNRKQKIKAVDVIKLTEAGH